LAVTNAVEMEVFPRLSGALEEACGGTDLTPIHGDVSVRHNALWQGGELAAMIDPGAVSVGPPALDFAWACAMSAARGVPVDALLSWLPEPLQAQCTELMPLLVRRAVSLARLKGDSESAANCRSALNALGAAGRTWID
jgi:hypothetical protein